MTITIANPPQQTSLVEQQVNPSNPKDVAYLITPVWYRWFVQALINRVQNAPSVVKGVTLTTQGASISTTAIPISSVVSGVYRLSYYARITTAAVTSSSLTVTFSWTEGGIALSSSFAAITGNTTTTTGEGSILIRSDAASPLSYATTYASNGAGEMKYALQIVAELVS